MSRKEFIAAALGMLGAAGAAVTCGDDRTVGPTSAGGAPEPVGRGVALPDRDAGARDGAATTTATSPDADAGSSADAAPQAAIACTDPLPESQLPDDTGHQHTLVVPAATLDTTFEHTFTTSVAEAHSHKVALSVADFGNLRGGETVLLPSTPAAADGHHHVFAVSCV